MRILIDWGQLAYVAISLSLVKVGEYLDTHPGAGYSCPNYCEVNHQHIPVDETLREFIMGKKDSTKEKETLEEKISEYEYDSEIFDTIDYYEKKINNLNGKIKKLRNAYYTKEFDKAYEGNRIVYYKSGKGINYRIKTKRKMGFHYQKKRK